MEWRDAKAQAANTGLMMIIDVKHFFAFFFYFKTKNAFLTFFIFPTFFINKKRWEIVPAITILS